MKSFDRFTLNIFTRNKLN